MVNNLSFSFSNSRGNSLSGLKEANLNDNIIDDGYYDDITEDINEKKQDKKMGENDNIINMKSKKKKGICCIIV